MGIARCGVFNIPFPYMCAYASLESFKDSGIHSATKPTTTNKTSVILAIDGDARCSSMCVREAPLLRQEQHEVDKSYADPLPCKS